MALSIFGKRARRYYGSYESDDNKFDYSSTDSSSEDDSSDNAMINIPDNCNPEDGAESDDDTSKMLSLV